LKSEEKIITTEKVETIDNKKKISKPVITKKKATITEKKKIENELWDDGMKIPDWLKTDEDK